MPTAKKIEQQAVPPNARARPPPVAVPQTRSSTTGDPLSSTSESDQKTPTQPDSTWTTVPHTRNRPPARPSQAGLPPNPRAGPNQLGFPPNHRLRPSQAGGPPNNVTAGSRTGFPPARGPFPGQTHTAQPGRGQVPNLNNLTQNMGNMNLQPQAPGRPTGNGVNPSLAPRPAPPPAAVTVNAPPRGNTVAPSATGLSTYSRPGYLFRDGQQRHKWVENNVIFRSPFHRGTFNKGDVISVPFHQPNMDANLAITDSNLSQSAHGPVFSKRRMFIVLTKHVDGLFCLPLYSHHSQGLQVKHGEERRKEYVEICDLVHKQYFAEQHHQSEYYDPLIHVHKNYPNDWLTPETVCHFTAGYTIDWKQPASHIGRLTRASYGILVQHYTGQLEKRLDENSMWPGPNQNPRIRHGDY